VGKPAFDEHARLKAKQKLLDAAQSGKIDEVMAKLRPPVDAEAQEEAKEEAQPTTKSAAAPATFEGIDDGLRMKAQQKLLEAAESGKIDEVMAKLRPPATQAKEFQPADPVDALRLKAKQALLDAAESGQLEDMMAKLRPPADAEVKSPVEEVKETEPAAVSEPAAAPATSEEPPQIDALRLRAKQTLLDAAESGKVDEMIAKVKPPVVAEPEDTEDLRLMVQDALLDADGKGDLDTALEEVNATQAAKEEEKEATPAPQEAEVFAAKEEAAFPKKEEAPVSPSALKTTKSGKLTKESVAAFQAGLKMKLSETIDASVKNCVGEAVSSAVAELRAEMEKRNEQAAELSNQMEELTKTVRDLQGKSDMS